MSERRQDLIALAILVVVPTILFADVLFGTSVLFQRDITTYYHPAKSVLREIVLAGEFPYWNPWFSAGQPMAANPEHEVFYPLTWLILLPSFNFGFHLLAVIHIHIAGLAMYALLRSMRLGRPAAVFGGLSFALGGVVVSMLNLWPCLFSLAWLPLTALYTRSFLRTGSRRAMAAAAFFLGLQLLVGEPVTAFLSGIILGMYAIAHGWRAGGLTRAARMVAAVGLISILALLVSAAQTLPGIDHFGDSIRSRGLEWDIVRIWSMPPLRIGELFFPHFFGFPLPDDELPYWGAHFYDTRAMPFVLSIYGGLAVAVLSLTGVIARIRGAGLFLAISVVSLVLAAGENTPLLRLLYESGIARSWRYSEKFTMMIGFAAAVFAACVLDRLLQGDARLRRIAVSVAATVTGVAVVATVLSHLPQHHALFAAFWRLPYAATEELLALSARTWTIEIGRGLLLIVILRNIDRVRRAMWFALLAVFMMLDLGPLLLELNPRLDRSFYDPPPAAAHFGPDVDQTRLFPYAQWEGYGSGRRTRPHVDPRGDLFWMIRNSLRPMVPADLGIRTVLENDFDLTALLPTVDFTQSMFDLHAQNSGDWLNIALSMSNGGYITVYERPEVAHAKAGGNLRLIQPTRVMKGTHYPRYYFASALVPARDRQQFVQLLLKNRYPRDVAFVAGPIFTPATGTVLGWSETANTATIDVEARGRAFLVMSVTPHKYWRVAIDGVDTEPIITNIGYQGIIVPAGRHTVTMRYRNPLIAAGSAVSLATLLGLGLFARRDRSVRPPQKKAAGRESPAGTANPEAVVDSTSRSLGES